MKQEIHPDHDSLIQTVRDWFHLPYEGMGYTGEKREWGTYWNFKHVYTLGFPCDKVTEFLTDVRCYYTDRPVFISVDKDRESELGSVLCKAGCTQGKKEIFLAHVGSLPQCSTVKDMEIEPVGESNIAEFAETRLKAFADSEDSLSASVVQTEINQRLLDLGGTGRGLLARIGGEPASVLTWYVEHNDVWIYNLGTRVPFRRQGIGTQLICACLKEGYSHKCRSVVINVETENVGAIQLYRRLGFRDEFYYRRRYVVED